MSIEHTFDEIMKAAARGRSGKAPAWFGQERDKEVEELKKFFPKGSTVFLVLRKRATSGMKRVVSVVAIKKGDQRQYALHPTFAVSVVTGHPIEKTAGGGDGIVMRGVGYDVGDSLVSDISHALYGNNTSLHAEWL